MPTRKRRDFTPLEYGYWDHPDPIAAARGALAGSPDLLHTFEEALEESDACDETGPLRDWMNTPGVPASLKRRLEQAGATEEHEGRLDEVEIARCDVEGGGMASSWSRSLLARRRDGWIHYRRVDENEDADLAPTHEPLDAERVFDEIQADYFATIEFAGEEAVESFGDRTPTRREIRAEVSGTSFDSGASSDFYDFARLEARMAACVLEHVLEHFASG